MAFRRGSREPDPDHPDPVQLDLGLRMPWEVDAVVAALTAEGLRLRAFDQRRGAGIMQVADGGRSHYRVVVHADDADEARAAFAEAGLI